MLGWHVRLRGNRRPSVDFQLADDDQQWGLKDDRSSASWCVVRPGRRDGTNGDVKPEFWLEGVSICTYESRGSADNMKDSLHCLKYWAVRSMWRKPGRHRPRWY